MFKNPGAPTAPIPDSDLAPAGLPFLGDDQSLDVEGVISIGASWDASSRGRGGVFGKLSRKAGSDLDAVAVLFQDEEPVTLCAGFDGNLMNPLHHRPGDGAITHSGDNRTGEGDGDDEVISIHLATIPGEFHKIVVMVSAFKAGNKAMGDKGFQGANNVLFTIYDGTGASADPAFCVRPSLVGTENCVIVAVLNRINDEAGRPTVRWKLEKRKVRVNVRHGDQMDLIRKAAAAN
ncbi:TerD family protein [Streptomyces sp. NEAU-Y11]|uniref:TerD family protein n=1 Tax=Streptomyces cucumeris TaxID=2962890 RepID=UPI0020C8796C|nr:TerD family protein [Streptomyces sp. NEAU-Y11]MCP9209619.1 TerD family protein [Streptomyces sp. NEAU-Y11]